jgi:hypothetical protein
MKATEKIKLMIELEFGFKQQYTRFGELNRYA